MREPMQPARAKQAISAPQCQQLAEAGVSATAGGDWEQF